MLELSPIELVLLARIGKFETVIISVITSAVISESKRHIKHTSQLAEEGAGGRRGPCNSVLTDAVEANFDEVLYSVGVDV